MLFEDGNRIDLNPLPQRAHIQEWVDSEAGFTVLEDPKGVFELYSRILKRFWTSPASAIEFDKACNEFWWCQPTVKGICRGKPSTRIISMEFVSKNCSSF